MAVVVINLKTPDRLSSERAKDRLQISANQKSVAIPGSRRMMPTTNAPTARRASRGSDSGSGTVNCSQNLLEQPLAARGIKGRRMRPIELPMSAQVGLTERG